MPIGTAVTSSWLSVLSLASTMNVIPRAAAMKKASTPLADAAGSSMRPEALDFSMSSLGALYLLDADQRPVVIGKPLLPKAEQVIIGRRQLLAANEKYGDIDFFEIGPQKLVCRRMSVALKCQITFV